MAKVIFFCLTFAVAFNVVFCATLAEMLSITGYERNVNTPEKLDKVVDAVLKHNIYSVQVDSNTSIFELLIPVFSSMSGISGAAQSKFYIEALFDHINKSCLSVILKDKKNQLAALDKSEIAQKIWFTINEAEIINNYKLKAVEIPEKTVILMLKALNLVDPFSCNTRGMVSKLAPFCESESCQELIYSSILSSLNCENKKKKFPSFKVKYNLKSTDKYDNFISSCYEIYKSERTNLVPLDNFIRVIINGPSTHTAADILLIIMEKANLIRISECDELITVLTRFLLNSESFNHFADQFLSDEDENIQNMKTKMLKIKEKRDTIKTMCTGSIYIANYQAFNDYIDLFRNNKDVLTEYHEIDEYFVINVVNDLNSEIFKLIENLNNQTEAKIKLIFICLSFIILNAIPLLPMKEFLGMDYELLLDAYLSPEIAELNPRIVADHLSQVILLPFAKLEISTLDKLLMALQRNNPDAADRLQMVVTLALHYREFDDESFLKACNTAHKFYETKQLSLSDLAAFLLAKLIKKRNYYLARKLFDFCSSRGILHKTIKITTERYLSVFENTIEFSEIVL